jgi:RNA polymerase sigma factor (sigma-70 family)
MNKTQTEQFDRLIRPLVPDMFKTAYRLTGHRADAEDLIQDVLTKLFPQTHKLTEVIDLKPWLMKTLHNRFIDTMRARQRSPATVSDDQGFETAVDPNSTPQANLANGELAQALYRALDTLTPESRSLVVLNLMEGYTLEQLTDVFNVPLGTLKSRLHTARSRLKKILQLDEPFTDNKRVDEYELRTDQTKDQDHQHA